MKNKPIKDEQLLILIAQGNAEAFDILFKKYKKLARGAICNCLQTISKHNEIEEYEMFFYELFTKAIKTYRCEQCLFRTYFNAVINNTLKGMIYSDSKKNNQAIISLNMIVDEKWELLDLIEDENEISPSEALTTREIELVLNSPLSKNRKDKNEIQRQVIKLRREGYMLKEIASMLNISITSAKRYLSDYPKGVPMSKIKLLFK